jgi:hypothetical protein
MNLFNLIPPEKDKWMERIQKFLNLNLSIPVDLLLVIC